MASSQLLFTIFAILVPSLIIFMFARKHRPNLPPGPPGWPFAGNLFQVARSGKHFIHYVRDLIPLYGPIFTLQMGARTIIIISSSDLAHEALIERGHLFASRPVETSTRAIFSCNKFTVNSTDYGPEWRSLRRNMASGMLCSNRIKEFSSARSAAMDCFIDLIHAEASANGGAVWVLRNARYSVFCILISMCFGLELDEKTIFRIDAVMKKVLVTLSPRMDDYMPLLCPFFSKQRKKALEVRREQIEIMIPLINKRQTILANHSDNQSATFKAAASFSYLDSLLEFQIDGRDSGPNDAELVSLCSEFLIAGTDTTATAIEWGIARLINNPSIQSKLYEEISAVAEEGCTVSEREIEGMDYLKAFVKELLRKHPPTFFTLSHAAVQPAKLGGYDLPTEANLEIYLPAISEDPRIVRV